MPKNAPAPEPEVEETDEAEVETETETTDSEPKSYVRTLTDPGGNELQFLANRRKDGTWSSYVSHRQMKDKKLVKSSRGASNDHDSLDEAKAEIEKGVKAATGQGWQERKAGGGGFKPRPDSFNLANLPKPSKK
jgi:hypothetical protein